MRFSYDINLLFYFLLSRIIIQNNFKTFKICYLFYLYILNLKNKVYLT